ncbi:MAG TPA: hypothetical protein VFA68_09995 [Terriglobales bacterium]|nr:hypothetical protein [Terriglobales bacterium]
MFSILESPSLQFSRSVSIGILGAAFLAACLITAGLVSLTIRICRKRGWLAKPRADRWHRGTPCLFGGVPIWVGFVAVSLVFLPFSNHLAWKLIAISSLVFGLGLVDDIYHLRPRTKLLIQILAATLVLSCGVVYPLRHDLWINVIVSMFWLVGITNAFNLLDNMDGLSAGVALISAFYLGIFYLSGGFLGYAVLVSIIAGAAAGFLFFNFNPARIFMGDAGSLFIGFLLGSSSLLGITHVSGVPALVFAPAVVLAIPIFDTFFVSVTRRLHGQRVSVGGTDHSSHRLVRLGLNERTAVLLLYALSAGSGAIAILMRHLLYTRAIGLIAFWFLFLFLFGIHLFQTDSGHVAPTTSLPRLLLRRLLTRDTLAFLIDPVVLFLSYYLAYFLRFRTYVPQGELDLFLRSWPIAVGAKFLCLYTCRIYRRSWYRGSIADIYRLAQAVGLGEVTTILLLTGVYRFNGYSRVVFGIDAVFSWALLLAVRKSFSLFRDSFYTWRLRNSQERRVFVLGTSEHAEVALRFLRDRRIQCAGLIDTNGGSDLGRCVWGAQVVGGLDDLVRLANQHGVFELILPENESVPYSDADFHLFCSRWRLRLTKLGLYSATDNFGESGKNVA